MEQTKLLPSGVQLWSKNVVACRSYDDVEEKGSNLLTGKIAFCSSLAVFVVDVTSGSVAHILSGGQGLMSAVEWSLYDPNLIASAGQDGRLAIWDLEAEKTTSVVLLKQAPMCMSWLPINQQNPENFSEATIVVATVRGSIVLWNSTKRQHTMLVQREVSAKLSRAEAKVWKNTHRPEVLRCNIHPSSNNVAVGYKDGRIEIISTLLKNQTPSGVYYDAKDNKFCQKRPSEEKLKAVTDLQWDPFSTNYLLASFAGGDKIVLCDFERVDSPKVVQTFPLNKIGSVVSLSWQTWAPGNFMTLSEKNSGIIRVWNVSQKAPIDLYQVTTKSSGTALATWGSLCVFPLESGAVCAYNAKRMLNLCETKPSHRETVFDVRFSPDKPDSFATCSFDGRVKLWSAETMDCVLDLKHPEKPIIYGVSWSPSAFGFIACCTFSGRVTVWNCKSGRLQSSNHVHKGPIYRCDWNQNDPSLLASSSADGTLLISTVNLKDGSIKERRRFKHPNKVFGCAWNPFYTTADENEPGHGPWIGSGCQDGILRIWNTESGSKQSEFELVGHTAKIFNVAWSSLQPGLLASGSDDKTINVWRLPQSTLKKSGGPTKVEPTLKITGHTQNVRALLWSTELENILYSGSWDGTIRIWDAVFGSSVACIRDHHADVYGIDVHPLRPFAVLSSSRDTTVRFWQQVSPDQVDQCCMELAAYILFDGATGLATCHNTLKGMHGRQLINDVIDSLSTGNNAESGPCSERKVKILSRIMSFFRDQPGLSDLWGILLRDKPGAEVVKTRLVHDCADLVKNHEEVLSTSRTSKSRKRTGGHQTSEQFVKELCKVGDFRSACEFLKSEGKWTEALSLAPAVSMGFWKEMSSEYAQKLANDQSEQAVPHWVASGGVKSAIDFYKRRGELDNGLLLAQVDLESGGAGSVDSFHVLDVFKAEMQQQQRQNRRENERYKRLARDELARLRATKYLERGCACLAACSLLSIDDTPGAIHVLSLAGEETLALLVSSLRSPTGQPCEHSLKLFARKCERAGNSRLALQLFRRTRHAALESQLLCGRVNFPPNIRVQLGLRHSEQYQAQAEERSQDLCTRLQFLVAAGDIGSHGQAIRMGISELCLLLQEPTWDIPRCHEIVNILRSIDVGNVLEKNCHDKVFFLGLSLFFGVQEAIWKQFDNIVLPMFRSLRELLKASGGYTKAHFPVSNQRICLMETKFMFNQAVRDPNPAMAQVLLQKAKHRCEEMLNEKNDDEEVEDSPQIRQELEYIYERLKDPVLKATDRKPIEASKHRLGTASSLFSRGLPNGNTRLGKRSLFTGEFIRGPSVALPDGQSVYLSSSDALLWSRVHPFSPLNTGARLFPSRYQSPCVSSGGGSPKSFPAPDIKKMDTMISRVESSFFKK